MYGCVFPYCSENETYYCDSISLLFLARLFGIKLCYRPGTVVARDFHCRMKNEKVLWLTSSPDIIIAAGHVEVLPQFEESFEDFCTANKILLSRFETIIIGISSPKQNELAREILFWLGERSNTSTDIHCLGAAVDPDISLRSSHLSGTGVQWAEFLIISPKRTLKKIIITLKECVFICLLYEKQTFLSRLKIDRKLMSANNIAANQWSGKKTLFIILLKDAFLSIFGIIRYTP